jgi:hypothetical protein
MFRDDPPAPIPTVQSPMRKIGSDIGDLSFYIAGPLFTTPGLYVWAAGRNALVVGLSELEEIIAQETGNAPRR